MPYRFYRSCNGGGIIIFVREDIPSKILEKHKLSQDIEGIFIELNFKKIKWLLFGTYHPPSQNDQYYFEEIDKAIDCYNSYDRSVLIGDFNSEDSSIFQDYLVHFPAQNQGNPKQIRPEKKFIMLQEIGLSSSNIKKFLYFRK